MASMSVSAHGIKRLTTQECANKNLSAKATIKFDSSFSILGPKSFEINGQQVVMGGLRMELGSDYTTYTGQLKNGDSFSMVSKAGKKSTTEIVVNGEAKEVSCTTTTKFRIY
jgi:hypothetical protein